MCYNNHILSLNSLEKCQKPPSLIDGIDEKGAPTKLTRIYFSSFHKLKPKKWSTVFTTVLHAIILFLFFLSAAVPFLF